MITTILMLKTVLNPNIKSNKPKENINKVSFIQKSKFHMYLNNTNLNGIQQKQNNYFSYILRLQLLT
jgi:hypothetical protein